MATTTFFEKTIHDKEDKGTGLKLEFGRSSFHHGENLMYFNIGDKSLIVDEQTGREIVDAMRRLGDYLGYR